MDGQAITTKSDLDRMFLDESMEAKPLSLSLLKSITNNFSHEIGRGGFAVVYKGHVGYREVAVKQLSQNCFDDEKEFDREVECLMKAKHKNIVRCLGYCSDTQRHAANYNGLFVMAEVCQRLLCFEYVPKGTLDEYIKDASREWGACYKIIKGVCEGLHYLHKERIVHRDLKPANILLDNDLVPKITDFGISRCFGEWQTHVVTSKVTGSMGYLAPELINNRKITFKSDIYSLGIIIIEILTGDKDCPEAEEVQEHWSHKLEGSQKELLLEQIRVCTEVAQSCLVHKPEKRPCAQTIIDTLKQTEIEEQCIEHGASSHNPDCYKSSVAAATAAVSGGYRIMEERLGLPEMSHESCMEVGGAGEPPASTLDPPLAAATPLGSTVAATNTSTKRRQFRIQSFVHREATDPETTARRIKMLRQAISKYYARDTKDMNTEDLYRVACTLVLTDKGEELYSVVETVMASEVQSLCRSLDDDAAPADSTLFLHELLTKWDLHIWALERIGDLFMYMDRTFVPTNFKTPTKELGHSLWLAEMVRSDKIQPRLIEAVKRQKGGEDELVPGVNNMLTKLGADINDSMPPILCFHQHPPVLLQLFV